MLVLATLLFACLHLIINLCFVATVIDIETNVHVLLLKFRSERW